MLKKLWLPVTAIWTVLYFALDWYGRLQTAREIVQNRGQAVRILAAILTSQRLPLALFLVGLAIFAGIYFDLLPSKNKSIKRKVGRWIRSHFSSTILTGDKLYFGFAVEVPPHIRVIIRRSTENPSYIELRNSISTTDKQRARFDEMPEQEQASVLRAIQLELNRSKIGPPHLGKKLEFICLHKDIPIDSDLTEGRLIDGINDVKFAHGVIHPAINSLLKPSQEITMPVTENARAGLEMSVLLYQFNQNTNELSATVQFLNGGEKTRRTILGVTFTYHDETGQRLLRAPHFGLFDHSTTPIYIEPAQPTVQTFRCVLGSPELVALTKKPGVIFGLQIVSLKSDSSFSFTTIECMAILPLGKPPPEWIFTVRRHISLEGSNHIKIDPSVTQPSPTPKTEASPH